MSDDFDFDRTLRSFFPGQKVFKRYKLVRQLGRGGMGIVWLAEDEQLEQLVALKFLPEIVASDTAAIDDLKRETRKALKLTHPNIVRIHDFLQDENTVAVSMEYVDGKSLTQLRVEQPQRAFGFEEVKPWIEQICQALDYAHNRAKIAHRDLKPSNILLTPDGEIKITDFGISATITDSTTRVSMHASSSGTPVYMSPQQMMGERPAPSDDIYSLGVSIYELLTGKPPFYTGNILLQVQNKIPVSMAEQRTELEVEGLSEIPPQWESVVASCLAKEAIDRPKDILQVCDALGQEAVTEATEPVEESSKKKEPKPPSVPRSKKRSLKPYLAFILLLVLGGASWSIYTYSTPQKIEMSYEESVKLLNLSLNAWEDPDIRANLDTLSGIIEANKDNPELVALAYSYRAMLNYYLTGDGKKDMELARKACEPLATRSSLNDYSWVINEVGAILFYLDSDYKGATSYLTSIIDNSAIPNDHMAFVRSLRAYFYMSDGESEKALNDVDMAIARGVTSDELKYYLYMTRYMVYQQMEEYAKAIKDLKTCLSFNVSPDDKSVALYYRAMIWPADEIDNKINDLDAIINMLGVSDFYRVRAMNAKASCLFHDFNQNEEAGALYSQVIESKEATPDQKAVAYLNRGNILLSIRKWDDAKKEYEAGLTLEGISDARKDTLQEKLDEVNSVPQDNTYYREALNYINTFLDVWDDVSERKGIEKLTRIIEDNKDHPDLVALSYAYRALAKKELGDDFQDDLTMARNTCETLTSINSVSDHLAVTNEVSGILSYLNGDYKDSIAYLGQALGHVGSDDRKASILALRALVYILSNDDSNIEKALDDANTAIALETSSDKLKHYLYMTRMWVYEEMDQSDKAIEDCGKALNLNVGPDLKCAVLVSRYWLWSGDDKDKMMNDLDAIINMPKASDYYRLNAMNEKAFNLFIKFDDNNGALNLYSKVLEDENATVDQKSEAHEYRGVVYEILDKKEEAKKDYEAGLALEGILGSDKESFQKRLQQL
jgi:serine/threonine protein kinase